MTFMVVYPLTSLECGYSVEGEGWTCKGGSYDTIMTYCRPILCDVFYPLTSLEYDTFITMMPFM